MTSETIKFITTITIEMEKNEYNSPTLRVGISHYKNYKRIGILSFFIFYFIDKRKV